MGKVVKDELEADAFAAEYVGNLTAVLALKEYDYRIIAIKGNG